jgi:hypothetical protein
MNSLSGMNWSSRPSRFLSWFSLFWIIGGLAFIGAGFLWELPRSTFWTIGGIWFAVGLFLRFLGGRMAASYAKAQQLKATGLPARGTIQSLEQTGLYINEQPQVEMTLQVEMDGRSPYVVTRKEVVPLIALGRLSSGQPLPLKVNPADPNDLVIEWDQPAPPPVGGWYAAPGAQPAAGTSTGVDLSAFGLGAVAGMAAAGTPAVSAGQPQAAPGMDMDALKTHLSANGIDGTGVLENVIDTGVTMNGQKLMILDMTVTVPGKAPYRTNSPSMVDPAKAARVVKGASIPITVDPNNPQVLMAEWDRA